MSNSNLSQKLPPLKSGLKKYGIVIGVAVAAIYIVKSDIYNKRDKTFRPEHLEEGSKTNDNETNTNIAKIRPGFAENTGKFQRKSEYEGASIAYASRKKGDRFSGILDFSWFTGDDKDK